MTCKWLFKNKEGLSPAGGIHYKARLVARGFSQKEGVDYNEIFLPVVRHTSRCPYMDRNSLQGNGISGSIDT